MQMIRFSKEYELDGMAQLLDAAFPKATSHPKRLLSKWSDFISDLKSSWLHRVGDFITDFIRDSIITNLRCFPATGTIF